MKFVRKIPKNETYIDGNLVQYYHVEATDQEIYDLNRKKNDDENCGQKKVYRYLSDGSKMQEFASVSEAARQTGIDRSSITRAANGVYYSSGGFLWEWAEE